MRSVQSFTHPPIYLYIHLSSQWATCPPWSIHPSIHPIIHSPTHAFFHSMRNSVVPPTSHKGLDIKRKKIQPLALKNCTQIMCVELWQTRAVKLEECFRGCDTWAGSCWEICGCESGSWGPSRREKTLYNDSEVWECLWVKKTEFSVAKEPW
jgi:hypothetical protein